MNNLKTIIINSSDNVGGASRAAYRINSGLRDIGIDSRMYVHNKVGDEKFIYGPGSNLARLKNILKSGIEPLPLEIYKRRIPSDFSIQWLPDPFQRFPRRYEPDIIHLNYVCNGFINIKALSKFKKPIVWTLHDMWPFTGGCHYSNGCQAYESCCGRCPQLSSRFEIDLSRWIWNRKNKSWKNQNITIVTPSKWLADCAGKSSLFKDKPIRVIPNGIDLDVFRPINKNTSRELLGLPLEKKLILFGAMNPTSDKRKGFQFLQPALNLLKEKMETSDIELIIFGSSEPDTPQDFRLKTNYLGSFNDDISLALLYSAVDLFVAPSIEDNLPNTVVESLACGNPCVAFNIGGLPDMIEHRINGYLAEPFDVNDLATGMAWVLENQDRLNRLSKAGWDKAKKTYSIESISRKYLDLYYERSLSLL